MIFLFLDFVDFVDFAFLCAYKVPDVTFIFSYRSIILAFLVQIACPFFDFECDFEKKSLQIEKLHNIKKLNKKIIKLIE